MRTVGIMAAMSAIAAIVAGSTQNKEPSKDQKIQQDRMASIHAELGKSITSAPNRAMKSDGLAGVMGGTHLKTFSGDPQEVFLPLPQLADSQVPICFFISCTPPDAVTEYRLRKSEEGNVGVIVHLAGKKQEVQIEWSSVVLLASKRITPNNTKAEPYCKATACVQSQAEEIAKLTKETWPKTGKPGDFAANVQKHIQGMKRLDRPKSLDALGILKCGENSICTANANLAAALMRSKNVACRSMAVIPTNSQRLEMHRIVEFFENGNWVPFDPSYVVADIPTKPWQNVIMAKTTTQDEEVAMKPRMGTMIGCPYGQEIELLTSGVTLTGQDMFWTVAKPLAEFVPTEDLTRLAATAWTRYLETGTLKDGQLKAVSAKSDDELVASLKNK